MTQSIISKHLEIIRLCQCYVWAVVACCKVDHSGLDSFVLIYFLLN